MPSALFQQWAADLDTKRTQQQTLVDQGAWPASPASFDSEQQQTWHDVAHEAHRQGLDPQLALAAVHAEGSDKAGQPGVGYFRHRVGGKVVRSPMGALGVTQVMPATAADYGLDPTRYGDNIAAGVQKLREVHALYQDNPRLAFAAYNAGEGAVGRANGIPQNGETPGYVRKAMAFLTSLVSPRVAEAQTGAPPAPVKIDFKAAMQKAADAMNASPSPGAMAAPETAPASPAEASSAPVKIDFKAAMQKAADALQEGQAPPFVAPPPVADEAEGTMSAEEAAARAVMETRASAGMTGPGNFQNALPDVRPRGLHRRPLPVISTQPSPLTPAQQATIATSGALDKARVDAQIAAGQLPGQGAVSGNVPATTDVVPATPLVWWPALKAPPGIVPGMPFIGNPAQAPPVPDVTSMPMPGNAPVAMPMPSSQGSSGVMGALRQWFTEPEPEDLPPTMSEGLWQGVRGGASTVVGQLGNVLERLDAFQPGSSSERVSVVPFLRQLEADIRVDPKILALNDTFADHLFRALGTAGVIIPEYMLLTSTGSVVIVPAVWGALSTDPKQGPLAAAINGVRDAMLFGVLKWARSLPLAQRVPVISSLFGGTAALSGNTFEDSAIQTLIGAGLAIPGASPGRGVVTQLRGWRMLFGGDNASPVPPGGGTPDNAPPPPSSVGPPGTARPREPFGTAVPVRGLGIAPEQAGPLLQRGLALAEEGQSVAQMATTLQAEFNLTTTQGAHVASRILALRQASLAEQAMPTQGVPAAIIPLAGRTRTTSSASPVAAERQPTATPELPGFPERSMGEGRLGTIQVGEEALHPAEAYDLARRLQSASETTRNTPAHAATPQEIREATTTANEYAQRSAEYQAAYEAWGKAHPAEAAFVEADPHGRASADVPPPSPAQMQARLQLFQRQLADLASRARSDPNGPAAYRQAADSLLRGIQEIEDFLALPPAQAPVARPATLPSVPEGTVPLPSPPHGASPAPPEMPPGTPPVTALPTPATPGTSMPLLPPAIPSPDTPPRLRDWPLTIVARKSTAMLTLPDGAREEPGVVLERVAALRQLADRARQAGNTTQAAQFEAQANEAEQAFATWAQTDPELARYLRGEPYAAPAQATPPVPEAPPAMPLGVPTQPVAPSAEPPALQVSPVAPPTPEGAAVLPVAGSADVTLGAGVPPTPVMTPPILPGDVIAQSGRSYANERNALFALEHRSDVSAETHEAVELAPGAWVLRAKTPPGPAPGQSGVTPASAMPPLEETGSPPAPPLIAPSIPPAPSSPPALNLAGTLAPFMRGERVMFTTPQGLQVEGNVVHQGLGGGDVRINVDTLMKGEARRPVRYTRDMPPEALTRLPIQATQAPPVISTPIQVQAEREKVEPSPTPAQMEAGDYTKGHLTWQGLDVSIETAKGGVRRAADGSWEVSDFPADYGYIRRTEGADGDALDVYVGDALDAPTVWVVDQVDANTGKFDEHKALIGFRTSEEALATYRRGFSDGRANDRLGALTPMSVDEFKAWVRGGDTTKALAPRRNATLTSATTAPPAIAPGFTAGDRVAVPHFRGGPTLTGRVNTDHRPGDPTAVMVIWDTPRVGEGGQVFPRDMVSPSQLVPLTSAEENIGMSGAPPTPAPAHPARITVSFPRKPSAAALTRLKDNGFRWSTQGKRWEAPHSDIRAGIARALAITHGGTDNLTGTPTATPPTLLTPSTPPGALDVKVIPSSVGSLADARQAVRDAFAHEETMLAARRTAELALKSAVRAGGVVGDLRQRNTAAIEAHGEAEQARYRAEQALTRIEESPGASPSAPPTLMPAPEALPAGATSRPFAVGDRVVVTDTNTPGVITETRAFTEQGLRAGSQPTSYTLYQVQLDTGEVQRRRGESLRLAEVAPVVPVSSAATTALANASDADVLAAFEAVLGAETPQAEPENLLTPAQEAAIRREESLMHAAGLVLGDRVEGFPDLRGVIELSKSGAFVVRHAGGQESSLFAPNGDVIWRRVALSAPLLPLVGTRVEWTHSGDVKQGIVSKADPGSAGAVQITVDQVNGQPVEPRWDAVHVRNLRPVTRAMRDVTPGSAPPVLQPAVPRLEVTPPGAHQALPAPDDVQAKGAAEGFDAEDVAEFQRLLGFDGGVSEETPGYGIMRQGVDPQKYRQLEPVMRRMLATVEAQHGTVLDFFTKMAGTFGRPAIPYVLQFRDTILEEQRRGTLAEQQPPEESSDSGRTGDVGTTGASDQGALATVSSDDVSRADEAGEPGTGSPGAGTADAREDVAASSEGETAVQPGVGPGAGGGISSGRGGRPRTWRPPAVTRTGGKRGSDYHILTPKTLIPGGAKQRYLRNVAAIRVLKMLEAEQRLATPAEQQLLALYSGWGASSVQRVFETINERDWAPPDWKTEYRELKELLTEDEYRSAKASTPNAHYTSYEVIEGIYKALARLGFQHGRILEPSLGVGNFFGVMPLAMRTPSSLTGIELDDISARIAHQLYPSADVRQGGFENAKLAPNFFDVVVSNVPFGNYKVADRTYARHNLSIHNYFFAKALDYVKPGGLVAFVTSPFTLDAVDGGARRLFASKANLIGAIRLPTGVFKGVADTETSTDILFFQKHGPGMPDAAEPFADRTMLPGTDISVNEYYARHPAMMLGTMERQGTMYRADDPVLIAPPGQDIAHDLAEAVKRLPRHIYEQDQDRPTHIEPQVPLADALAAGESALQEGAFTVRGNPFTGDVYQRRGETFVKVPLTGKTLERVRGMANLRDVTRKALALQFQDAEAVEIAKALHDLNLMYDAFVAEHGFLSGPGYANRRAYHGDPDLPLLLSLEDYDGVTEIATKMPIFTQRTIRAVVKPGHVDTPQDALTTSLTYNGRIDWEDMARLSGMAVTDLQEVLAGQVFQNPNGGGWETAAQYLAGDVRTKLADAQAAAQSDPRFASNIPALEAVQPAHISISDVQLRLGVPWVPVEDYQRFLAQTLDLPLPDVTVRYNPPMAKWDITVGDRYSRRQSVANTETWGVEGWTGDRMAAAAMNMQQPTIRQPDPNDPTGEKTIPNPQATLVLRDKMQRLQLAFQEWVLTDPLVAQRLETIFNETMNRFVAPVYDGSHLEFPGLSPAFTMRPHQKNAIWRGVQEGTVFFAHSVGAGKTAVMAGTAMELRRIGQARKPVILVPNNLISQWPAEFLRYYPAARILAATQQDLEKDRRQQFFGRIATGDWDSVILPYSSFQFIPVSDELFNRFLQTELQTLESYLTQYRAELGKNHATVKDLEKAKKRLEAKLKIRRDVERQSKLLTWEELGVDSLFVDEAHSYKNLFLSTKMGRIAGVSTSDAKRAFDLFTKVRYLQELMNGRNVFFASGTPISNSIQEAYTIQRYLQPQMLEALDSEHFDAWANNFGDLRTRMEVSPTGKGFTSRTTFSKLRNAQVLLRSMQQVLDVQTADMLSLPRPGLIGGKPEVVSVPASPALTAYVETLLERSQNLKNVDPHEDNMLRITSDGRKAAVDIRLALPGEPEPQVTKLKEVARRVASIYHRTNAERSTQIVFMDMGVPTTAERAAASRGDEEPPPSTETMAGSEEDDRLRTSLYMDLRAKLLAAGVDPRHVAFIHEANTDARRISVFRRMKSGELRILIGNTPKLAEGVNVQDRLFALHHVDPPWKPAHIEQREGRILRPGNMHPEVQIYRYVTEGSFDAYMWTTIERKQLAFGNFLAGKSSSNEVEDLGDASLQNAAEAAAAASGNPLILEAHALGMEIERMQTLRTQAMREQQTARRELTTVLPGQRKHDEKYLTDLEALHARYEAGKASGVFTMTVGGKRHADPVAAGEQLLAYAADLKARAVLTPDHEIGRYYDIPIIAGNPGSFSSVQKDDEGKTFVVTESRNTTYGFLGSWIEISAATPDSQTTVDRFSSRLERVPESIAQIRTRLQQHDKRAADLQAVLDQPLPFLEELARAQTRRDEIMRDASLDKPAEDETQGVETEDGEADDFETPGFSPGVAEESAPYTAGTPQSAEALFPLAGPVVDGRTVRAEIPNLASIAATFDDGTYTTMPGIRSVPMAAIDPAYRASAGQTPQVRRLADKIAESKALNPLIVVVDADGPYILEGGHRLDALIALQAQAFPAVVLLEEGARPDAFLSEGASGATASTVSEPPAPYDSTSTPPVASPVFFSQALRVLDDLLPERTTPGQVRQILKRAAGRGVKQEELKWLGLEEWLQRHPHSLTKQEVMDWLRSNEVQVAWTVLGDTHPITWQQYPGTEELPAWDSDGTSPGNTQRIQRLRNGGYLLTSPGGLREMFNTLHEAQARGEEYITNSHSNRTPPPRHAGGSLVLPGAEQGSHREVVFMLPEGSPGAPPEMFSTDRTHYGDFPNVTAWLRMNDRIGPQGERLLHVEEVQSKWQTEGRQRGFTDPEATRQLREEAQQASADLGKELAALPAQERPSTQTIMDLDADLASMALPPALHDAVLLYRRARHAANDAIARQTQGVPPAPFVTTSDWYQPALKWALHYAASHGYAGITWTTGTQQAERYSLRKVADELVFVRHPDPQPGDNIGSLYAYKDGEEVDSRDIDSEQHLAETIGAANGKKLLAQPVDDDMSLSVSPHGETAGIVSRYGGPAQHLIGEEFVYGGAWAEALYDRTIPNWLNKYAQGNKWGAKTTTTAITIGATPLAQRHVLVDIDTGNILDGADLPEVARMRQTLWEQRGRRVRIEERPYVRERTSVHFLPITDLMRHQVTTEGQQLFEPGAFYAERPDATPATRQLARDTLADLDAIATGDVSTLAGGVVAPRAATQQSVAAGRPGTLGLPSARGMLPVLGEPGRGRGLPAQGAGDAGSQPSAGPSLPYRRLPSHEYLDTLRTTGRAALVGQKAPTVHDLAVLAYATRDPRIERLHYVYLRGDDIVGVDAVSSRLPSSSAAFFTGHGTQSDSRHFMALRSRMTRLGADGFYEFHNHPSTKTTPSSGDIALTIKTANVVDVHLPAKPAWQQPALASVRGLPGFRGHVVIDHDEYSVIDAQGKVTTHHRDNMGSDPFLPGKSTYGTIRDDRDLARLAQTIEAGRDLVAIFRSQAGEVRAIQRIPAGQILQTLPTPGQREAPFEAWLRGQQRSVGAEELFLYQSPLHPDIEAAARHWHAKGLVRDLVTPISSLARQAPDLYGSRRAPRALPGMRVAEAEPPQLGPVPMTEQALDAWADEQRDETRSPVAPLFRHVGGILGNERGGFLLPAIATDEIRRHWRSIRAATRPQFYDLYDEDPEAALVAIRAVDAIDAGQFVALQHTKALLRILGKNPARLDFFFKGLLADQRQAIIDDANAAARAAMATATAPGGMANPAVALAMAAAAHRQAAVGAGSLPMLTPTELAELQMAPDLQAAFTYWLTHVQAEMDAKAPDAWITARRVGPLFGTYLHLQGVDPTRTHPPRLIYDPTGATVYVGKVPKQGPGGGGRNTGSIPRTLSRQRARAAIQATGAGQYYNGDPFELLRGMYVDRYAAAYHNRLAIFVRSRAVAPDPATGIVPKEIPFGVTGRIVPVKLATVTWHGTGSPPEYVHVPQPIDEMWNYAKSMLANPDQFEVELLSKAARQTTAIALMWPADGVQHAFSLMGQLFITPGIGHASMGMAGRALAWTPLRFAAVIADIMTLSGPAFEQDLRTLALHGGLRAASMGMEGHGGPLKRMVFDYPTTEHASLWGMESRGRVAMLRALRHMHPGIADADAVRRINNSMATYVRGLQPPLVRWLRTLPLAAFTTPFASAMVSLGKSSLKGIVGRGPGGPGNLPPGTSPPSGSSGGWDRGSFEVVWAFAVLAGIIDILWHWWRDPGHSDPLEQPGLTPGDLRLSKDAGKVVDLPMRVYAPQTARGLRLVGIRAFGAAYMRGERNIWELGGAVGTQLVNDAIEFFGFLPRGFFTLLTGYDAHLTSRGLASSERPVIGVGPHVRERALAVLKSMMPGGEEIGELLKEGYEWGEGLLSEEDEPSAPHPERFGEGLSRWLWHAAEVVGFRGLVRGSEAALATQGIRGAKGRESAVERDIARMAFQLQRTQPEHVMRYIREQMDWRGIPEADRPRAIINVQRMMLQHQKSLGRAMHELTFPTLK